MSVPRSNSAAADASQGDPLSPGSERAKTLSAATTTTPPPAEKAAPPVSIGNPGRLRLLIVEDDETSLHVLVRLLRHRGHEVHAATTVAAALELAATHPFDLVISDLGLPDGKGHDLMREIKHLYGWPGIALSGFGMESDLQDSKAAGFASHLVKPVAVAELIRAIAAVRLVPAQ